MDDITFCLSDCQRTDCYRHPSNIQDRTIPHSYADFKETETCPEKTQLSKEDATKGATFDCISRQAVIDTLDVGAECLRRVLDETDIVGTEREKYKWGLRLFEACISDMKELPSAQPESRREWYMKGYRDAQAVSCTDLCVDCPLFDKEKHECPRFNRVIPRAIEEVKPSWIPVTPDSPPLYMPVLTWDGGTRHVEQRIPYIRDEYGEKIISDWWIDGDEKWDEWAEYQPNLRDGCAIKWMPLPEPYKEGQDD